MIKTLYEDQMKDVFLQSIKKHGRPKLKIKKGVLKNTFYICSDKEKGIFHEYIFKAEDYLIFCRKSKNKSELAFMNVNFSFLKKNKEVLIKGKPYYSLKFIKRKTYEELFHENEEVIDEWFEHFKEFCILTKFRNYFKSMKVLGKGSFAKVFMVSRLKDQRNFAVKVFNKKLIMDDDMERKCLLYEIKMMREMNNYRILKLYEIYEGENFIYCLCELYKGDNLLNAIIKKGSQPEKKGLTILLQILQGLVYLHKKTIIHRDLKPENILFKTDENLDIGIVDLGFATFEADYKSLFVRCGTPGYVAPEVLNDMPYDCKSDVYSAGIIFYIILTGKLPFNGKSHSDIVYKNSKGKINFDKLKKNDIGVDTMNLLKWMLVKDPNKRCSSFEAITHSCFNNVLSASPLIKRNGFNPSSIQDHEKITKGEKQKKLKKDIKEIPNRIEDLSPLPKTPMRNKKKKNSYFKFNNFNKLKSN